MQYYAAINCDENIRLKSSSGGVFYALAEQILNKNGIIFGAAWNKDWNVVMKYIDNISNINQLMKSKYVIADKLNTFEECKEFLDQGKYVLYSGTPCQIASLKKFLKIDYEKLYLVNVCCHGLMPKYIWRDYLEAIKKPDADIISIDMRNKDDGWLNFNMKIEFSDNSILKEKYLDNYYIKSFLKDKYLLDSCYECKFKGDNSQGDFIIGDFWTVYENYKPLFDNKGTSFIAINSEKGVDLIKDSNLYIYPITKDDASKCNSGLNPKLNTFNKEIYNKSIFDFIKKPKIGIMRLPLDTNFGGNLGAYALEIALKRLGFNPETLDFFGLYLPFADKYINIRNIRSLSDIKETDYKIIMIGSDQTWRKKYTKKLFPINFLSFTKDWNIKRLSYGTSFGVSENDWEYSKEEDITIQDNLKLFDNISCREFDGVNVLKNKFNIDAQKVCDPVLLLDKEEYLELCKDIPKQSNKLFNYVLDIHKKCFENINQYMRANNLRNNTYAKYDLLSWLAGFRDSDYIITDSYHGCLLSIIFNKPFICYVNKERGDSRFKSLMQEFNLQNNFIFNWDELNDKKFNDYNCKEELIKSKELSLLFLKNILLDIS